MADSLLADLLPSWQLHLKAERKSASTVSGYTWSVRVFLKWCDETGTDAVLDKVTVQTFLVSLVDGGAQAATARTRYAALRRFAAWLADEGEIPNNPLADMKPPKLDSKVTRALSDDEYAALVKACQGKDFLDRRDEAIVRMMMATAVRAGELIAMQVSDVDLVNGLAVIRKGKGGKGRVVQFGPKCAAAIDRYLRLRRGHRLADSGALWLGGGGRGFAYHGLNIALKGRAAQAGIEGFHLHLMRSTAATAWLRGGGSEQGLMTVAGWSTRSMLDRYTQASAAERATQEARGLGIGEV
ncbi:tyrosine-type recombinase/integrase [Mycolicibacterium sp. Y3]